MAAAANLVDFNHRRQRRLVLGASAIALLLSIMPRNERALFVVEGPGIVALGAIVPTEIVDYVVSYAGLPSLPTAFRRSRFIGGRPIATNPFVPAVPQGPAESFADPAGPLLGTGPSGVGGPLTLGDPGGFLPSDPLSFAPPGFSPVGQEAVDGVNPPVAAIPEPTTWLTMILGFLAVGATLRRAKRSVKANPVALEGHRVEA